MSSDQSSIDDIINQAKQGSNTDDSTQKESDTALKTPQRKDTPNKIIDHLDDVTLQSEVEVSKIIDIIVDTTECLDNLKATVKELTELSASSNMGSTKAKELLAKINTSATDAQDKVFDAMNLLQYQDVLRQKIEKIASALTGFYDYLGDFLGRGKRNASQRATGKHIESAQLTQDQKLNEIDKIIESAKDS